PVAGTRPRLERRPRRARRVQYAEGNGRVVVIDDMQSKQGGGRHRQDEGRYGDGERLSYRLRDSGGVGHSESEGALPGDSGRAADSAGGRVQCEPRWERAGSDTPSVWRRATGSSEHRGVEALYLSARQAGGGDLQRRGHDRD